MIPPGAFLPYTMTMTSLDQAEALPFRMVTERRLPASPQRVFEVLAEPSTWPHWFTKMTQASWTEGENKLGALRTVHIQDGLTQIWLEKVVAWEPGRRFSFNTIEGNLPLAKALVEDFQLSPDGDGCRFVWTVHYRPTWMVRILHPLVRMLFRKMFNSAADGLTRYLSRG